MNHMSPITYAIIGAEVLSLIICLILLLGSRMESNRSSKRTLWFDLLIISCLTGCLCDALSWILDGHAEWISVLIIATLGSMIMTMVMMGVFFSYLSVYISERRAVSNIPVIIGWAAVAVGVIATLITSITGNLFTFESGYYSDGAFYSIYVIANISYIVFGIIEIIIYRKTLDLYDKLAAGAYMLIPMIAAVASLILDGWDFSYPAITVSLLILYIMMQSDRVKKLEREGNIVSYQAAHDELTGVYNRSAYEKQILLLEAKEGNCGVIFSDLNGLKYTNDTLGHAAGDSLLVRYSKILTNLFRMNEIYRIGGDEFICIMENAPEEVFRKRVLELESALNLEAPPLACVGAAYGSSKEIESIRRDAEIRMYAEKKIIHERFPKMERES